MNEQNKSYNKLYVCMALAALMSYHLMVLEWSTRCALVSVFGGGALAFAITLYIPASQYLLLLCLLICAPSAMSMISEVYLPAEYTHLLLQVALGSYMGCESVIIGLCTVYMITLLTYALAHFTYYAQSTIQHYLNRIELFTGFVNNWLAQLAALVIVLSMAVTFDLCMRLFVGIIDIIYDYFNPQPLEEGDRIRVINLEGGIVQ